LQAGGHRFDPDRLHQFQAVFGCVEHTKINLKAPGIEAGVVFFENL
jgi:hypothetical protein